MNSKPPSTIEAVVKHHEGPTALSRLLGGIPSRQEIVRWVSRGWASPMHILKLKPHLPKGTKIEQLYADREVAAAAEAAAIAARAAARKAARKTQKR